MSTGLFAKVRNVVLGNKKSAPSYWLEHVEQTRVKLDIQDEVTLKQLGMIDLTTKDLQIAKTFQPLIAKYADEIVASFYQSITNIESLKSIIQKNSTLERLRATLQQHIIEMFSGQIDQTFLDKRIKIANIHYQIGLEPKWYMGAFQSLQMSLLQIVHNHVDIHQERRQVIQAITKILNFEQQLVLEAYETENIQQRQQQYDDIKEELKTKIIAISKEVAHITEHTNSAVQELVASSEIVNKSVAQGVANSRDTQRLATGGQGQLLELKSRIDAIFSRAEQMKDMVQQLTHAVQDISQVVSLVQSIADDTNLLSLNSSIEAARAGEHGAGFAVVSQEIRHLATQTRASVDEIRGYITTTQQFTENFVDIIGEVHHFIQAGKSESDATEQVLQQILEAMSIYLGEVETVEDGVSTLIHNIKEVGESMKKVSTTADTLYGAVENL